MYVATDDLSLPKGRVTKLLPKYIGPFKVLNAQNDMSTYKVELPAQLRTRNLHDRFHWSQLHPHIANDNTLFPHWEAHTYYDFGTPDDQEWLVDKIITHKWDKNNLKFQVRWNLGDTTWEPYEACKELQAIDEYLQLVRVEGWRNLPRGTWD